MSPVSGAPVLFIPPAAGATSLPAFSAPASPSSHHATSANRSSARLHNARKSASHALRARACAAEVSPERSRSWSAVGGARRELGVELADPGVPFVDVDVDAVVLAGGLATVLRDAAALPTGIVAVAVVVEAIAARRPAEWQRFIGFGAGAFDLYPCRQVKCFGNRPRRRRRESCCVVRCALLRCAPCVCCCYCVGGVHFHRSLAGSGGKTNSAGILPVAAATSAVVAS